MNADGPRSSLRLLLGILRHPGAWWTTWRNLAVELFKDGGATVETMTPPPDEHIAARTIIQPDGDVLVFFSEEHMDDTELLLRHRRQVGEWYARSRAATEQAVVALRTAISAASAGSSAWAGWSAATRGPVDGMLRPVLAVAVARGLFTLVRIVLRKLLKAYLGRTIDRWTGAGVTR